MELSPQYVHKRLQQLARKDTEHKVFGASVHGYRLNPPLPADELAAFEAKHKIALPEDYKLFITEIGNGGAGPFYGLFPFGHHDEGPWKIGVLVGDVGKPFPHTKAWNLGDDFWAKEPDFSEALSDEESEQQSEKWNQLLSAKYWAPKVVNGAIPICHLGCLLRQWLVVHGKQRGLVWTDYRFDCEGLFPLTDKAGKQMTFTDWYLDWLKKPKMRVPIAPRT
jgi:hypothetical protein